MPVGRRGIVAAMAAGALTACSLAPAYRPPALTVPGQFAETGPWVAATPQSAAPGRWWRAFGDPTLIALEGRLDAQNPGLAEAVARHDAARAALGEARSALLPQLDLAGTSLANRQSNTRPLRGGGQPDLYSADTLDIAGGYEFDLWGRVRQSIAAAKARADAAGDDVAATRLALETELASRYLELRGLDRLISLFEATLATYSQADRLIRNRFAGGIASGVDLGRADAQLADAEAQLADLRSSRALTLHAVAALVGSPVADFALPSDSTPTALPDPPPVVPSALLQRRPDVAAAERRMFAANREIGVARAAYFPQISLGGLVGFQSTAISPLLAAPNLFWAIGPGVALNLFDGGKRRARVQLAQAQWAGAAASYRRVALGAFQQVEDDLALLHYLGDASAAQQRTVAAAVRAGDLSLIRYTKGAADFLEVAVAEANALAAKRRAIQLETRRAQAQVDLIRAIGGDWAGDGH